MASKMGLSVGAFKNKLSPNQSVYKLTDEEENQLKEILLDMAADIQDVAGMTFNEALKKIGKTKK